MTDLQKATAKYINELEPIKQNLYDELQDAKDNKMRDEENLRRSSNIEHKIRGEFNDVCGEILRAEKVFKNENEVD